MVKCKNLMPKLTPIKIVEIIPILLNICLTIIYKVKITVKLIQLIQDVVAP
jgi:hypothetical protein